MTDPSHPSPDIDTILTFWFNRKPMEWLIAPPGLDSQIQTQFSHLVLKARSGELDDWAADAHGSLALVVLLDQFPRNIFRGTADAYSSDTKAAETATRALAQGFDHHVTVMQASAFYMTMMQQESLVTIVAARGLFEALKERCVTEDETQWAHLGIEASKRHAQQLLLFGRYPTRNSALGRQSTEAEDQFLKDHVQSL